MDVPVRQEVVVPVGVVGLVRRHAKGVLLQDPGQFPPLVHVGGGGLLLRDDARVGIQRQVGLVAHEDLAASPATPPGVGVGRVLLVDPEAVHPRGHVGGVHHREAVRDEPPLPGQLDDPVVDPGEALRPQARAEVGQRRGMGRRLVGLQPAEPLEGHLEVHLLHDAAVRDVVEELEKQDLEEHHRRGRRPPQVPGVAALADPVDEAPVHEGVELPQEVLRPDEAVVEALVEEAALGGVAPEHPKGSGGRENAPIIPSPAREGRGKELFQQPL